MAGGGLSPSLCFDALTNQKPHVTAHLIAQMAGESMKSGLRVMVTTALSVTAYFAMGQLALAAPAMTLDSGSTAWMLTSALLVLMMTLPGLALFYGGMVH